MNSPNASSEAAPLVAALAEELAFTLTADLMAEQYRRPSPALDRIAAAKAFLERQRHPVGPTVLEMVEIAIAQGGLPG